MSSPMTPERFKHSAPPDDLCDTAYSQIAEIARTHCLIVQAAGGVMTIATPSAQRSVEGVRENTLQMHCMNEVEVEIKVEVEVKVETIRAKERDTPPIINADEL